MVGSRFASHMDAHMADARNRGARLVALRQLPRRRAQCCLPCRLWLPYTALGHIQRVPHILKLRLQGGDALIPRADGRYQTRELFAHLLKPVN